MPVPEEARRFEVFTGEGRRRRFSAVEKAAIVAESYDDGASVCGVARRHGLRSTQLFTWRREARIRLHVAPEPPLFVPAIVARPVAKAAAAPERPMKPVRRRRPALASIELEVDGIVVRVGRDAGAAAIAAVIGALKAGA
ncbi:MAG: transposase [Gluconacetobacter diazotrophicus]|nr:transposase [Gluconacetobacter diazotrophicus]